MRLRWFHGRWTSRLWRDRVIGIVTRLTSPDGWNAYLYDYIGTFPTRAAAIRAVNSANDPKKGYFPVR